jgi:hypothetical protein
MVRGWVEVEGGEKGRGMEVEGGEKGRGMEDERRGWWMGRW